MFCAERLGLEFGEDLGEAEIRRILAQITARAYSQSVLDYGGKAMIKSQLSLAAVGVIYGVHAIFSSDLPPEEKEKAKKAFYAQMTKMLVFFGAMSVVNKGAHALQGVGVESKLLPEVKLADLFPAFFPRRRDCLNWSFQHPRMNRARYLEMVVLRLRRP